MKKQKSFGQDGQIKTNSQPRILEKEDLTAHMNHLASKATKCTKPALWIRALQDQVSKSDKYTPFFLEAVEIVRVVPKQSPSRWSVNDLLDFDQDKDIIDGLLEVRFRDIATSVNFYGYVIEANMYDPSGTSVSGYRSPSVIKRPAVIGSTVTEILDLDPGTTYYVKVYAVDYGLVQISPKQRASSANSTTTLLRAPILDLRETEKIEPAGVELWAGMDGRPIFTSKGNATNFSRTYFQFKAVDENGNTIDSKLVETNDGVLAEVSEAEDFFKSVLSTECLTLTLSVSMGCINGHMYRCLSDTAFVEFERLNYSELHKVLGLLA